MAIGSAKLCGIQLVENFNYPYSAATPVDFWNRWHMSLSRWIRDYLFFPLAGNRPTLGSMLRAAVGGDDFVRLVARGRLDVRAVGLLSWPVDLRNAHSSNSNESRKELRNRQHRDRRAEPGRF